MNQARWDRINSLKTGASGAVCRQCSTEGNPYPHDNRPYGIALEREGYPLIRSWLTSTEDDRAKTEYVRFVRDAISRSSRPMLNVAAIAGEVEGNTELLLDTLNDEERSKLLSGLRIAAHLEEGDEFDRWLAGIENS